MEKEEKKEIQKFEYLENKESFLNELKTIFCNSLKAIIWLKKWTQALKIFFSKFGLFKVGQSIKKFQFFADFRLKKVYLGMTNTDLLDILEHYEFHRY